MSYFPPTGSTVGFQSDPTKLLTHASVSGNITLNPTSVAVLQGTTPWAISNTSVAVMSVVPHSVATLQGTNPWMVQLTSGSVITTGGNSSVQVVGLMPPQSVSGVGLFNVNHTGNGSILTVSLGSIATAPSPASVSGVGIFNTNPIGNGSVFAKLTNSSVTAYQGVTPWVTTGSVQGVMSVLGTLPVTQAGTWSVFTGMRNDAIASTVGVDLTARVLATDSAGRVLTKPYAANEAYVFGVSSTVNTNPSSLLAVAGTGLRNYMTDIEVVNTGSVSTLVTFRDGDASLIGRTIAPAGGGSNIRTNLPYRTGGFNQQIEFTATTATSILYVTARGYKAP